MFGFKNHIFRDMDDLEPVQKKTVWLVMKVDIKLFEVLFKELELFPLEKK